MLWLAVHDHLVAHRDDARFLQQVEASPYDEVAQARAAEKADDTFAKVLARTSIADHLVDLPRPVLSDLALGPAIRLAASGTSLSRAKLGRVAGACWRAVTPS